MQTASERANQLEHAPKRMEGPASTHPIAPLVIQPPKGLHAINLGEIWQYRELLYFFAWRDVKVRYKQTLIGVSWVVLQPVLTMVIFTVVFGGLLQVETGGDPYAVFAFAALLPWNFFATALARAGSSLVLDANLISRVYFPRLILPASAVFSLLLDSMIAFLLLVAMLFFYGIVPGPSLLALPLFVLFASLTALGVGLWAAALNVRYRDVGYLTPFVTQVWLFLTPVVYPSTIIPASWKLVYSLNPMVGVVEGFRWTLLGQQNLPPGCMLLSLGVGVALFGGGLIFFRRFEREFADVV